MGSVGILGGGISGLVTACELHRQGIDVTLYEKGSQPGGVIQSVREGEWLIEKGPNTLMINRQAIWDFLEYLKLTHCVVEAGEDARKRFIVKDNKTVPLPLSAAEFIKTNLFSTSAKFRLLKETMVSVSEQEDESISKFISRRLGKELLEYAVNPFVSGIYAGTPETLSIKHTFSRLWELEQNYGSLTKGVFKSRKSGAKAKRALISFEDGLQALPRAMHKRLGDSVWCNTEVKEINRTSDGWSVCLDRSDGSSEQKHKLVISTLPAYVLQKLFKTSTSSQHLDKLSEIYYAPLSVISLGFRREQVEHPLDGFGMLLPATEPFRLLGALFSSSLFPHRTPDGHVLLTSFAGGGRNPELAYKSTEELMTVAIQDLSHLLHIHGSPVFSSHTFWQKAIPQYEVGYDIYLKAIKQLEEEQPGLLLAGNYRNGVSVSDCIINGTETARRAAKLLKN